MHSAIATRHVFMLFALGAIWSLFVVFTKICAPVLGPTITVFLRCLFGALFLFPIVKWHKTSFHLKENWKFYTSLALINTVIPLFFFAFSAPYVSGSLMAVINGTTPLWNIPITYFIFKKKQHPVALAGLVISFIGLVVFVKNGISYKPSTLSIISIILLIIASALYTVAALIMRKYKKPFNPTTCACATLVIAALMYIPALPSAFATLPWDLVDLRVLLSVLMLGVLCSGFTNFLYFKLIKETSILFATSTTFLMPIFGTLFSILFIGEICTARDAILIAVIIAGVVLISIGEVKSSKVA